MKYTSAHGKLLLKQILQQIRWEGVNRQNLLQDRVLALVNMVMEFGLHNRRGTGRTAGLLTTKLHDDTNTDKKRNSARLWVLDSRDFVNTEMSYNVLQEQAISQGEWGSRSPYRVITGLVASRHILGQAVGLHNMTRPSQPAALIFIKTYLLIPWRRVLLKKLTGSAASQETTRIFGTRRFLTVLTIERHLSLS